MGDAEDVLNVPDVVLSALHIHPVLKEDVLHRDEVALVHGLLTHPAVMYEASSHSYPCPLLVEDRYAHVCPARLPDDRELLSFGRVSEGYSFQTDSFRVTCL